MYHNKVKHRLRQTGPAFSPRVCEQTGEEVKTNRRTGLRSRHPKRPLIPDDVIHADYRPVPGGYMVDRNGLIASNVRAGQRGYPDGWYHLSPRSNSSGVAIVSVGPRGGELRSTLAKVVLEAWVGSPPGEGYIAAFKDGDRRHMTLDNLCWRTRSEHVRAMVDDGRYRRDIGQAVRTGRGHWERKFPPNPSEPERKCTGPCGLVKPADEFGWYNSRHTRRKWACYACQAAYERKRRESDPSVAERDRLRSRRRRAARSKTGEP